MAKLADTFPLFPELPPEIQHLIWDLAILEAGRDRIIPVRAYIDFDVVGSRCVHTNHQQQQQRRRRRQGPVSTTTTDGDGVCQACRDAHRHIPGDPIEARRFDVYRTRAVHFAGLYDNLGFGEEPAAALHGPSEACRASRLAVLRRYPQQLLVVRPRGAQRRQPAAWDRVRGHGDLVPDDVEEEGEGGPRPLPPVTHRLVRFSPATDVLLLVGIQEGISWTSEEDGRGGKGGENDDEEEEGGKGLIMHRHSRHHNLGLLASLRRVGLGVSAGGPYFAPLYQRPRRALLQQLLLLRDGGRRTPLQTIYACPLNRTLPPRHHPWTWGFSLGGPKTRHLWDLRLLDDVRSLDPEVRAATATETGGSGKGKGARGGDFSVVSSADRLVLGPSQTVQRHKMPPPTVSLYKLRRILREEAETFKFDCARHCQGTTAGIGGVNDDGKVEEEASSWPSWGLVMPESWPTRKLTETIVAMDELNFASWLREEQERRSQLPGDGWR